MKQDRAFILIADHFDEAFVVNCVGQMRQSGLATSLIGISPRCLKGTQGITLQTDLSLGQLTEAQIPRLLLIPGGETCTATLLADPRVHQLLEMTLRSAGFVAVMASGQRLLADIGIPVPEMAENFMAHNEETAEQFIEQVIARVKGKYV